jgi:glyoxylase-like metal-dependent hydrolase (beta-lactamase superfamily II)
VKFVFSFSLLYEGPIYLFRCLATPCHTRDSICYYVTDTSSSSDAGVVFTGDTLFIGGCGVFFEGTGAEMHAAFELMRSTLPDNTVTYVGHEYTAGNLRFARSVDPENAGLARLAAIVDAHPVTVGRTTIGDEKEWNVFWRLTSDPVRYVFCSLLSVEMHTFPVAGALDLARIGLLRRRSQRHNRAK